MYRLKLRSDPDKTYELHYGWYAYAGNRKVLGWYLLETHTVKIRPFYDSDAQDVFMWSSSDAEDWNRENFNEMLNHKPTY